MDAEVLELAASLKWENPTGTGARVARILRIATGALRVDPAAQFPRLDLGHVPWSGVRAFACSRGTLW